MQKILEKRIEQIQKILEKNKEEWQRTYEEQANAILDNRILIDKFSKKCRNIEHLQFYLIGTTPIPEIKIRYRGQEIAKVILTKDSEIYVTTKDYDENNKKDFECKIQLKDEIWDSEKTEDFINHFKRDIDTKNKEKEKARIQSLLLAEFAKTSSYDKLLTGIQPIKIGNLYYELPISINSNKDDIEYINILTRTKIRKTTIIEIMEETQTEEKIFTQATDKALFLLNLLNSNSGDKYYKIMGYHGRKPNQLTIKVCIGINKKTSSKVKEFEPYQIQCGVDTIEYHYMYFGEDKNKITSIRTSVNG